MKTLSGIKNLTRKTIITSSIVIAAIVGVASFSNVSAQNISLGGPRDCDKNAVVYCGAGSVSQLQNKYNNGVAGHNTASSIHHIFSYFGISGGDVSSMGSYAVAGEVYRDGIVKVNGKIVATDAWTAGRQNMSGSTKVTYAGTTFYKRTPSVSFVSSPLAAYIVMRNGVFQFAILASCGNPVSARPKIPAKPTPVPTHKPTPTPYHSVCIQNACVKVPGAGNNMCTSNANCHPISTPHHYACVANACVIVSGAGSNTCTSNYNCQPHPTATCTPTPYYSPYHN